jgi:uncharacterized membrane protein
MTATLVLVLAFLIGVLAGLRSLSAPAVVALAARQGWMNLDGTALSFMGSTAACAIFALLALGELVADKLPSAPNRTAPLGLGARIATGGLCGACVALAGSKSLILGALLGIAGGLAGTYGGYAARSALVRALRVPDLVIAVIEDAIAIGGSLLIVSRF